ncbi:translation initiation factor IF-2 [Thermodesulfobacterium sp.]|jgi:translation initiation factor IF-2|uniref:translation initiation factor IF-2 n=1 Tax=Thermodesulfobacterium sp. TaxID=1965289 RepID=UPI00257BC41A|nr:translation initiation factor IF-2 [Thermodesulfobacterium sp.]MBZ4681976.1 translation initiation factor [Thermodesulfobacterium sp.]MDN5379822.1 translation initiation factor [Thermodesulfobacterium sp.]
MTKRIKLTELAEELHIEPKELVKKLKAEGFPVKTTLSSLSEEDAEKVRNLYGKKHEIIVFRKEEIEEKNKEEITPEEPKIESVELPLEQPKKKKLVLKKKKISEELKVEEKLKLEETISETKEEKPSFIEEPSTEKGDKVSLEVEALKEEKVESFETSIQEVSRFELSQTETPLTEPSQPKTAQPSYEKRVVTEFKPRKERGFKGKEQPVVSPPKEEIVLPEEPKIGEKEDFKKKKKEKDFREEKKKAKKKSAFGKREKERIDEFFIEEEPTTLFEEKLEVELVKPKEKDKKERVSDRPPTLPPKERKIKIFETIQVSELAKMMGVKVSELIKKALQMGMPVTANQSIDADIAAILADEFGYQIERAPIEEEILLQYIPPSPEELKPRPPVITVMGHVDHGKTTLLDAIRKTDVASKEAGGITQHIGAYTVKLEDGRTLTFIDTPGHEAFTSMRARGAQVTDIVILVVAADDGVMEQTKEAIEHAKAAKVPIVVAINKIDKPEANPERVKSQLAELGLIPEEWGGDTLMANISARNKIGINELLELVLLQAEMLELKAAYDRPARGRIIESKLDKGRGPVATVLVQEGTLKEGDIFVAGLTYGRVRAMFDSYGKRVKEVTPSMPVEVLGFEELPQAGDDFIVLDSEEKAKKIAEYRQRKAREAETAKEAKISLEKLFEKLKEGELKELNIVLKADTQGTLEALQASLLKLSTDKVKVNIIRAGIGAISESDVMLASASNAIVIGFNVKPSSQARDLAKKERVDIKFYDVIYQLTDDVKKAMAGLLEPEIVEEIKGLAEVRAIFKIPKVGVVAGCYVKEGVINRNHNVRVIRDGVVVYTGKIASLRRFKEDVKEVAAGYECGVRIEGFNDIKEGDLLETFELKKVSQEL